MLLVFSIGLCGGYFAQLPKDNQLADYALYECSKPKKVEVTLKEMEDGSCSFMAMGAE
jgi:hypothetical protein